MRVEYDGEADALYIYLGEGDVRETVKISEDVLMDIGEDGKIRGIEILETSKKIPLESINLGVTV